MRRAFLKFSGFAMTAAFLCAAILPASAASFHDTENHWAKSAILELADRGAIKGYEDGSFRPDASISRAETATVIQNIYQFQVNTTGEFSDVPEGEWFADAVYALKSAGIINGVGGGLFAPNNQISRQDTAVILSALFGMDKGTDYTGHLVAFEDASSAADYAKNALGFLVSNNVLNGRDTSTLAPCEPITRAEFVTMLLVAEDKLTDEIPDNADDNETPAPAPGGSGGSGSSGGTTTPPVSTNPLNLDYTKIVEVYGVNYAILVFEDPATDTADYTYSLSGLPWHNPTPVNTAKTIFKMQLPDDAERTLALYDGSDLVEVIKLSDTASTLVTVEDEDTSLTLENREPYLVLTTETIPLAQYLMFIDSGAPGHKEDGLWIYPTTTTVNTNISTLSLGIDATAGATTQAEIDFGTIEKEATIAVLFDMIANHKIAQELGIEASTTDTLLAKWENDLTKGIALNEDFSLYGTTLGDAIDLPVTANEEPKYVKYLTASGLYGTKVYFDTHKPDSQTAPTVTIDDINIHSDITVTLSEENETWFLYLQNISIPYGAQTYAYLTNCELSTDGKTITLKRAYNSGLYSGPTEYAGLYEATFSSLGFSDATANFNVFYDLSQLTFTRAWNEAAQRLELTVAGDYNYFGAYFQKIHINDVEYTSADGIAKSGMYTIHIPYALLDVGSNSIRISCEKYADKIITVNYAPPVAPPAIAVDGIVMTGEKSVTIKTDDITAAADWLAAVADSGTAAIKYSTSGNVTGLSLSVDEAAGTVTITTTSYGQFAKNTPYTISITADGYTAATATFTTADPTGVHTVKQNADGSIRITATDSASDYFSQYASAVYVNGTPVTSYTKGSDASYNNYVEIASGCFPTYDTYDIRIEATRSSFNYLPWESSVTVVELEEAPTPQNQSVSGKTFSFEVTDLAWTALVEQAGVSMVSQTSWGSTYNEPIASVSIDPATGQIDITVSYSVTSDTYTATIQVPGYKDLTVTF